MALDTTPEDSKLLEFVNENRELQDAFQRKHDAHAELVRIFKNEFPDSNLMCFGSTITGFALRNSDLDVVLRLPSKYLRRRFREEYIQGKFSRFQKGEVLNTCKELIEDASEATHLKVEELIDCTVPILKLSGPRGLIIDLSVAETQGGTDGTHNTHLLLCYGETDWRVKPLVVAVKAWALTNGLTGPIDMKLSGYGLALMVIFFLQSCDPPVLPVWQEKHPEDFATYASVIRHLEYNYRGHYEDLVNSFQSENTETLFNLFCNFFDFYSYFDFKHDVVSIRTGTKLDRDKCGFYSAERNGVGDERQWYKEAKIEDPIHR